MRILTITQEAAPTAPEKKEHGKDVIPRQRPDPPLREDVDDPDRRGHQADQARDGAQYRDHDELVPGQDEDEAPERPERSFAHSPRDRHSTCRAWSARV